MKRCKYAPDNNHCTHKCVVELYEDRAIELNIKTLGTPCLFSQVSYYEFLRPLCKYYEPIGGN